MTDIVLIFKTHNARLYWFDRMKEYLCQKYWAKAYVSKYEIIMASNIFLYFTTDYEIEKISIGRHNAKYIYAEEALEKYPIQEFFERCLEVVK